MALPISLVGSSNAITIFLLSRPTAQTDRLGIWGDITHILESLIVPYFFGDVLFDRHGSCARLKRLVRFEKGC